MIKGMTDVQQQACRKIVHGGMMDYDDLAVSLYPANNESKTAKESTNTQVR